MTVGEIHKLAQGLVGTLSTRTLKYLLRDLKNEAGDLAPYVYYAAKAEQNRRFKHEELAVYYEYLKASGAL